MPLHQFLDAALQRPLVYAALQTSHMRKQVGDAPRLQLIQKPQLLLGKGERKHVRFSALRLNLPGRGRIFFLSQPF